MTRYHYHHHDKETQGINDDLKSNPGVLDDGELLIQQAASASGDGMVCQNNFISFSSFFPFFLLFLFSSYSLFPQSLQVSVLLEGAPNAGKTALAASLAKQVILHFSLWMFLIMSLLQNFHNRQIFAVWVPVCEDLLSGRHGRVHGVCQVQGH